jgi:hypothetical protein
VGGLQAGWSDGNLTIPAHAFTLRLPVLVGLAVGDVLLRPRNLPVAPGDLLGAVLAAAARSSGQQVYTGCEAVDLVVQKLASTPEGALVPACTAARVALAARLAGDFAAARDTDFAVEGAAAATDSDGDLVVDKLSGSFAATLTAATGVKAMQTILFTGKR